MVERKRSSRTPKFSKISEEMQQWSALLVGEVAQWPDVTLKPMFGMTAFYRKAAIFGAVPATRSLGSPNSAIFKILEPRPELKLLLESDARVGISIGAKQKWYSFELSSPQDLRDAISWFSEAYELATPSRAVEKSIAKKSRRSKSK